MVRQNYRRALVAVHQRETSKLSGPIPPYLVIDVFFFFLENKKTIDMLLSGISGYYFG